MGPWWLAWQYVWGNRSRSITLIACVSLVCFLPMLVSFLTAMFQSELLTRSQNTPLLVGPKGSRYDLVLQSLYFEGQGLGTIPAGEIDRIQESQQVQTIPLFVKHHAKGFPVVGTTLDYIAHRQLRIASGTNLQQIGDCIVGARVATRAHLVPGSKILTDSNNVFDLAGQTPLRMNVVGVLAPSQTPDDDAIFVDLKTAWIIEGIGHGHDDVTKVDPSMLIENKDRRVKASAGVLAYTEITDSNRDSFHFHGDPSTFPITSILAIPTDERAMSLFMGRYLDPKESMQIVPPQDVMRELLSFVFRAKRFFDVQSILVGIATLLLLSLVMMLSARLRQREMETLLKIGASRQTIALLFVAEWVYISCASALVVAILLAATLPWASQGLRYLLFS
ncbi:hypothetical protein K2X85_06300 [bacterium]|nr:hypothetical protein [bacterium]